MADAVSGPVALVAGAGAAVVALLGVEPQALAWSMVGAILGAPLAPPSGRVRQVVLFGGVVMACALLGTVGADVFGPATPRGRNAWCMVLGGIFHPASAALISAVPGVITTMLHAFAARRGAGGSTSQGDSNASR